MKVLAFTSQKGGSGKTTLAGHIAVQAETSGAGPVAIVDTDPQGSLADWWNERAVETPVFVQSSIAELSNHIELLRNHGFKLLVIDTPPAVTETISTVIGLSDLVVIPTRPSPHDLRAAGLTIDMVEEHGKPLVFVVNGATQRARITGEAAIALSQHGTVAPVTVHQRTDFAVSMIDGRTVMELNKTERSRQEITALWEYLEGRLFARPRQTKLQGSMNQLGGKETAAMPLFRTA